MIKHLRLERDTMLEEVTQLEKSNESLQEQLKKANEKFQLKDQELEVIEGTERSRLQVYMIIVLYSFYDCCYYDTVA